MADDTDQERYYTGAGDIYGVLRALRTERSTINIQFNNRGELYTSLVLDASVREKAFLLDEIVRREAHEKISAGTPFSLRATINGIKVYANELKVSKVLKRESGMVYRVEFPEKLLYLQRRDAYRVKVPAGLKIDVQCQFASHSKAAGGQLVNMSATGFRLAFSGQLKPSPQMLEKFIVTMTLPQLPAPFTNRAEVIFSEYNPDRNETVCGCRFVDLNRQGQVIINRFVTQLQREAIA